ncbi:MAG: hypothetical protein LBG80_01575 [Bacteroidales bacterium]|jgi:hypothetical protein|nr:hypothetical protein [Bacteroidales bacterium]
MANLKIIDATTGEEFEVLDVDLGTVTGKDLIYVLIQEGILPEEGGYGNTTDFKIMLYDKVGCFPLDMFNSLSSIGCIDGSTLVIIWKTIE